MPRVSRTRGERPGDNQRQFRKQKETVGGTVQYNARVENQRAGGTIDADQAGVTESAGRESNKLETFIRGYLERGWYRRAEGRIGQESTRQIRRRDESGRAAEATVSRERQGERGDAESETIRRRQTADRVREEPERDGDSKIEGRIGEAAGEVARSGPGNEQTYNRGEATSGASVQSADRTTHHGRRVSLGDGQQISIGIGETATREQRTETRIRSEAIGDR